MLKELSILQQFVETGDQNCWLVIHPEYMKTLGTMGSCKIKFNTWVDREICVNFFNFHEYIKTMWDVTLSLNEKKLTIKSGKIKWSVAIVDKPSYYDMSFNFTWNNVKFNRKQMIEYGKAMLKYTHDIPQWANTRWVAFNLGTKKYLSSTDSNRLVVKDINAEWESSFIVTKDQLPRLLSIAEFMMEDEFEFQSARWLFISNKMVDCHLIINEATPSNYQWFIDWYTSINTIKFNREEMLKWLSVSQIWISDAHKWVIDLLCMEKNIYLSSVDVGSENEIEISWWATTEVKLKLTLQYLKEVCLMSKEEVVSIDISDRDIVRYTRPWLTVLFWIRK